MIFHVWGGGLRNFKLVWKESSIFFSGRVGEIELYGCEMYQNVYGVTLHLIVISIGLVVSWRTSKKSR